MKHSIIGILAIVTIASAAVFAQKNLDPFIGSWEATTTPRICKTGAPITVFKAQYNLDLGGTLDFVSAGTGSGGRGREQVGQWEHVSKNHYRFKLKAFVFDAAGVSSSYQIVTQDVTLARGGRKWSSVGDSRTYDFDGNEINAGCSSIVASRMTLD